MRSKFIVVAALAASLICAGQAALAGNIMFGPGPGLTGNDTGGIITYAPGLDRGAYHQMAAHWCARLGPAVACHQHAPHLRRLYRLRLHRQPVDDPLTVGLIANRPARPAPKPAPRPRRCRRAECAGRARAGPRSAAAAGQRARPRRSRLPARSARQAASGGTPVSAATGSATSASSSQNTSQRAGIPLGQEPRKGDRLADIRQGQDAALLGGLDRVGAHALGIDARDLAVAGEHRLQPRDAHLDRLLHHVVEPGRLERREQVMQVRRNGFAGGSCHRSRAPAARLAAASLASHSPSRPLKTRTWLPALSRSTVPR